MYLDCNHHACHAKPIASCNVCAAPDAVCLWRPLPTVVHWPAAKWTARGISTRLSQKLSPRTQSTTVLRLSGLAWKFVVMYYKRHGRMQSGILTKTLPSRLLDQVIHLCELFTLPAFAVLVMAGEALLEPP